MAVLDSPLAQQIPGWECSAENFSQTLRFFLVGGHLPHNFSGYGTEYAGCFFTLYTLIVRAKKAISQYNLFVLTGSILIDSFSALSGAKQNP